MNHGKPIIIKCKIEAKRERSDDEDRLDHKSKQKFDSSSDSESEEEQEAESYIEEIGYSYEGYISSGVQAIIIKLSDENGHYVAGRFFYTNGFDEDKETILLLSHEPGLKEIHSFCLFPNNIIMFPEDALPIERIFGEKAVKDLNEHVEMPAELYGGFFDTPIMTGDLMGYYVDPNPNSIDLWSYLRQHKQKGQELLDWVKNARQAALKVKFLHDDLSFFNIMYKWYPETNSILYRMIDLSSAKFPVGNDTLEGDEEHIRKINEEWDRIENSVKNQLTK
jgi:serine/threonine-protein kinase RIO1